MGIYIYIYIYLGSKQCDLGSLMFLLFFSNQSILLVSFSFFLFYFVIYTYVWLDNPREFAFYRACINKKIVRLMLVS